MNILLTGCRGQLGTHLQLLSKHSANKWYFTDIAELDIMDRSAVVDYCQSRDINLIVNCAAYTNVDAAESNEDAAYAVNAESVGNLAHAMAVADGVLIHVSTDYVFAGDHCVPYTEGDEPSPRSAYGRTKLAGEEAASRCRSVTVRTAWLYSEYGKNFLLTMRRLTAERESLSVVFDQVGSPTYAGDLAAALFDMIENNRIEGNEGIYHFTNEGVCSWYDFALAIAKLSGHDSCRILPCHSSEFPSAVSRPHYSVLDKTKYKTTFGLEIPHWTDALARCIEQLNKLQRQ